MIFCLFVSCVGVGSSTVINPQGDFSSSDFPDVQFDGLAVTELITKVRGTLSQNKQSLADSLTNLLQEKIVSRDSDLSDYRVLLKEFQPTDPALLLHYICALLMTPTNRYIVDCAIIYLAMFDFKEDAERIKRGSVITGLFERTDQRPNRFVKVSVVKVCNNNLSGDIIKSAETFTDKVV